ncbi:MAG: ROK family transcriptional regulator [Microbacterium sp.]|uniref:ROK family transcriptional regulator n=1 Tax=Microbacterium sp. TaxID=51671 RepID=UPI0039E324A8
MSEAPSHPDWRGLSAPERRVAVEVLIHGPEHRSALAQRLGLSPTSLTRLTKPLLAQGFLEELKAAPTSRRSRGRPTEPIDVLPDPYRFVGVKLTGDHAYAVLTNLRAEILKQSDRPLPETEPHAVVDVVAALVDEVRDGASITAVGVAASGRIVDGTRIPYSEFLDWHDVDLGRLVREATSLPTVIVNDVGACTAREAWFGAGRESPSFALVTIGAGIGYGLVVGGEPIFDEDTGITLVGHMVLDNTGPLCPLGHHGCAAAMLTSVGIVSTVSAALGRPVGYEECLQLAEQDDPVARHVVLASARALGRLLSTISNVAMVHNIQVTGDGVGLADRYWQEVRTELDRNRDPHAHRVEVDIRHTSFYDWAEGAAAAAIQLYALGRIDTATTSARPIAKELWSLGDSNS